MRIQKINILPNPPLLLALLKEFEGFRARTYICAGGFKTIGYGHKILSHEYFDAPLSEKSAEALLRQDLQHSYAAVIKCLTAPLEDHQLVALLLFTFNVGGGAFYRSTLRQKVNRADHMAATQEFHRWIWAGGRKQKGLIQRRALEAKVYGGLIDT